MVYNLKFVGINQQQCHQTINNNRKTKHLQLLNAFQTHWKQLRFLLQILKQ